MNQKICLEQWVTNENHQDGDDDDHDDDDNKDNGDDKDTAIILQPETRKIGLQKWAAPPRWKHSEQSISKFTISSL